MRLLDTEIVIDAPPQTVWSVLDDLERYPEWNNAVPELSGRTTVGRRIKGILRQLNTPDRPINPELIRIVGSREMRWKSVAPENVFSAEHIFILESLDGGTRTRIRHSEIFDGPVSEERWPALDTNLRQAYEEMNRRLKERAEAMLAERHDLHPAVGKKVTKNPTEGFTIRCTCADTPVQIEVSQAVYHNHLCGCSKCWKPSGAIFAQVAIVPAGSVKVMANDAKLEAVDDTQSIQRQRCKTCGVHLYGKVSDQDHHFYGLEFVHPELATADYQPEVEFAAFVSSIIEKGTPATEMVSIRNSLKGRGIAPYDGFSPELMDVIAWHMVKLARAG